jgi:hypothetical protein
MKLGRVLDQIDSLSDDDVIFARRPWNPDSEAVVGRLDDGLGVPKSMTDQGFDYFLGVYFAQEVLEDFGSKCDSAAERRDLIIHYAENDAYPDWILDR